VKAESVKSKAVFEKFTDKLIKNYNLNPEIKEQFLLLTFGNYNLRQDTEAFIVYEDWWLRKPEVVKSKIKSILKISKRIYARQCQTIKINKYEADLFLEENHICGSTNSKIKYGLFYNGELVAVATFASQRQFRDGSRSAEMLRFCTKNGFTITGGLDKLLKAYIRNYKPGNIMTYVNKDWGSGEAFLKLGFEIAGNKPPVTFYVNTKNGERIPEKYFTDLDNINSYAKIKNKGSIKMIKKVY